MKRKFSDRANWRRVIRKSYSSLSLYDKEFKGIVTFLALHELRDPLYKEYNGKRICLADTEYLWVQHFPKGEHFVVTTMFDSDGNVVQWYIDICKTQGMTEQRVPWFDDLYLDIVVLPSGEIFLMDEDELEEAFIKGDITGKDVILAKKTASRLLKTISMKKFTYFSLSKKHVHTYYNRRKEKENQ